MDKNAIILNEIEKVDNYESTVTYHENHPKWQEMIKISIPGDRVINSHIKFEIYHLSNSVSGKGLLNVAYLPFNPPSVQVLTTPGEKELVCYRIDHKTLSK